MEDKNTLVKLDQLAHALQLPRRWLQTRADQGTIPSIQIGRSRYFSLDAVAAKLVHLASLIPSNSGHFTVDGIPPTFIDEPVGDEVRLLVDSILTYRLPAIRQACPGVDENKVLAAIRIASESVLDALVQSPTAWPGIEVAVDVRGAPSDEDAAKQTITDEQLQKGLGRTKRHVYWGHMGPNGTGHAARLFTPFHTGGGPPGRLRSFGGADNGGAVRE